MFLIAYFVRYKKLNFCHNIVEEYTKSSLKLICGTDFATRELSQVI
jgi:hypothetical protein